MSKFNVPTSNLNTNVQSIAEDEQPIVSTKDQPPSSKDFKIEQKKELILILRYMILEYAHQFEIFS